jgi:hypothetical protein
VLRGRRHDHVGSLIGAGGERSRHIQLIDTNPIRRGPFVPQGPRSFAPPVMRRSCRPRVGQAARCVSAPDSSGSSPGGRGVFPRAGRLYSAAR